MSALLNRPTRTLLQIGLAVFGLYLLVLSLNATLLFDEIQQWLPPALQDGASIGFGISIVSSLAGQVVMLAASWLLLAALVILVDGEPNGQRLLGWLAFCMAPSLLYALAITFATLRGGVDASELAHMSNEAAMADTVKEVIASAFASLAPLRALALVAAVTMVGFGVKQLCRLNVTRWAIVLGVYSLFLALMSIPWRS